MRKVGAVMVVLFRCGIIGAQYGAVLGVLYNLLDGVTGAVSMRDFPLFLQIIPVAILFGAQFGMFAGFVSGVLGASLGGAIGYGIGGFIGTGATLACFFKVDQGFPFFVLYPSIWGAAFGLVLGLHIRRRVSVLPYAEWLAESIYSCPLGGWLGWRRHHARCESGLLRVRWHHQWPHRIGRMPAARLP